MITDEDSESGSLPSQSSRLSREASVGLLPASGDGVCEVTPRHGNMPSVITRRQGRAGHCWVWPAGQHVLWRSASRADRRPAVGCDTSAGPV